MHDCDYYEYDTFAQDSLPAAPNLERWPAEYALQMCLGLGDCEVCHASLG